MGITLYVEKSIRYWGGQYDVIRYNWITELMRWPQVNEYTQRTVDDLDVDTCLNLCKITGTSLVVYCWILENTTITSNYELYSQHVRYIIDTTSLQWRLNEH